jgi:LysM domain
VNVEFAVDSREVRRRSARVRLTRRGRVVVLVFFLLVAGVGVALAAPASRAAGPAGQVPTAEVQQGDTIWSIAERELPGRDPVRAVEEIRELNGMADYTIHPGQHVILPRRR